MLLIFHNSQFCYDFMILASSYMLTQCWVKYVFYLKLLITITVWHAGFYCKGGKPETPHCGKSIPLQAWNGPEGSRKLRFPDFMTMNQDGCKVVSLPLSQEKLLVLISFRGWVDPRATLWSKGFYVNEKFQWHQLGSNQHKPRWTLSMCVTHLFWSICSLYLVGFGVPLLSHWGMIKRYCLLYESSWILFHMKNSCICLSAPWVLYSVRPWESTASNTLWLHPSFVSWKRKCPCIQRSCKFVSPRKSILLSIIFLHQVQPVRQNFGSHNLKRKLSQLSCIHNIKYSFP